MLICHHQDSWKPVVVQRLSGKRKSLSQKVPDFRLKGENESVKMSSRISFRCVVIDNGLGSTRKITGVLESGVDLSRATNSYIWRNWMSWRKSSTNWSVALVLKVGGISRSERGQGYKKWNMSVTVISSAPLHAAISAGIRRRHPHQYWFSLCPQ